MKRHLNYVEHRAIQIQLINSIKMQSNTIYGKRDKPTLRWRIKMAVRILRWKAVS